PLEHQEKACRKSGRLFQVMGKSEKCRRGELRTHAVVGGCHANGEPTGEIKSKRLYRPKGG
ncbi:MAG: hypothetical protein MSM72_02660, partial [Firmicutes bacterium]|nr:hypothetical protein [Bacillota bacterium]